MKAEILVITAEGMRQAEQAESAKRPVPVTASAMQLAPIIATVREFGISVGITWPGLAEGVAPVLAGLSRRMRDVVKSQVYLSAYGASPTWIMELARRSAISLDAETSEIEQRLLTYNAKDAVLTLDSLSAAMSVRAKPRACPVEAEETVPRSGNTNWKPGLAAPPWVRARPRDLRGDHRCQKRPRLRAARRRSRRPSFAKSSRY